MDKYEELMRKIKEFQKVFIGEIKNRDLTLHQKYSLNNILEVYNDHFKEELNETK